MISYADLVTVLFTVFVVLFVASQGHREQQVAASLGESFVKAEGPTPPLPEASRKPPPEPVATAFVASDTLAPAEPASPPPPHPMSGVREQIAAFVSVEGLEQRVRTRLERRGLVVSLVEAGFFDAGSARPRADTVPLIDKLGRLLTSSEHHIRIEGHTDDTPIRTAKFPSNWELSTARATWLVAHLATRFELEPQRLSAAGYSEFRPIASNETASGRAMNRRVDIVLLSAAVVAAEEPPSIPALGTR